MINASNQDAVDAAVLSLMGELKEQDRCNDNESSCYAFCEDDEFFRAGECLPCTKCNTLGLYTFDSCTRLGDAVCMPLGHAISVSNSGVMVLEKGVYSVKGTCGGIVNNKRTITIEAPDGAAKTVIDCSEDSTRHFDVARGSTLILNGVTLLNGGSDSVERGGCIRVSGKSSTLIMFDVVMTGCIAQYGGGVYASDGAAVSIGKASVLSDITALQDGGCVFGEDIYVDHHHVMFILTPENPVPTHTCHTYMREGARQVAVQSCASTHYENTHFTSH